MFYIRWVLVILNLVVAVLNFKEAKFSHQNRDIWAGIAWLGSAGAWLFQAIIL